jgi:hypothetical protein
MLLGFLLINIPYSISKIRKIKKLTTVFWLNSFLDWTIKVLEKARKRQIKNEKQTLASLNNFQLGIKLYVIVPLTVGVVLLFVTELTLEWILLITIAAAPTILFFEVLFDLSGRRQKREEEFLKKKIEVEISQEEELEKLYDQALDSGNKRLALKYGRLYYAFLRDGQLTTYDEQAIQNDLLSIDKKN